MPKIPILDLKKQIAPLRKEIDSAIKQVIDNVDFVFGKEIGEFEDGVSRYCGVRYALGVSNGTDALRLSLLALGIKPGDGVICPDFTFYATAGAVVSIGAVPVFADIDPLTYNISVDQVEKIIRQTRLPKVKAVIAVHLYGQCAEMDAINKICAKYNLKVIEDAAQAFGAEYKGRSAGAMGDCAAVSFFPAKNLGAFGDAGMVLTNSKGIAEKLRLLRNQGSSVKYSHLVIGHNHRLDTLQAAVLKVKLKHLDSWNRKRRDNAAYFNRNLKDLNIRVPFVPGYNKPIYHHYVLRLESFRSGLMKYLREKGIDTRVYYPTPLHLQKCFKYLGYKKGDFPESEKASLEVLAIPVYPELTKGELGYIVSSIREFMLR